MQPEKDPCTYTIISQKKRVPPKIIINKTAMKWIRAMVEIHPDEIGFFGAVDTLPDNTYYIRDIFYPKHQLVNGGTCEISSEGEAIMANWIMDHGRSDDITKMRFWAHSHHDMSTSPSSQDENEAIDKMNKAKGFYIRAVCNKKGEMSISFYDYENEIRFDHIKWSVEDIGSEAEAEIALGNILGIISLETKTSSEKLKLIQQELIVDNEYEKIKAKIEELKKINIPDKNPTYGQDIGMVTTNGINYPYHGRDNYGNLEGNYPFTHHSFFNKKNGKKKKDKFSKLKTFQDSDFFQGRNESFMNDAFVDNVIEEWRKGIV